ncbi:hypothetical protein HK16_09725 [Acetobacter senegalensis]|uniref:Uncharacterized protein n=2 Tax=Acetobacter TaxID=434 RepID=A0A252EMQ0_9PROT|nr:MULTISPECIES: hypothetical protein [Acetobacter]ATJ90421.1 hypothetical protein CIW82_06705 [Acetobacter tropicalis]OUL67582.1 hypothetical protein HK16_09725 [Acetobacter senegalensis]
MITSKKITVPPMFKIAYSKPTYAREWARFGMQAKAPDYLLQLAAGSDDVIVATHGGVTQIFVRKHEAVA